MQRSLISASSLTVLFFAHKNAPLMRDDNDDDGGGSARAFSIVTIFSSRSLPRLNRADAPQIFVATRARAFLSLATFIAL